MSQVMETDDFLEHYGVKGMKWGVRRQKRLDRLNRVASGTANRRDKTKVLLTDVSQASMLRRGGLKGAAASRARELQARKDRIEKGQGTIKDLLALHGADRLYVSGKA